MNSSFPAKINQREYEVLTGFNRQEFQGSSFGYLTEVLAARGLLERGQKLTEPGARQEIMTAPGLSNFDRAEKLRSLQYIRSLQHDYRLTKRGELMALRYQRQQAASS